MLLGELVALEVLRTSCTRVRVMGLNPKGVAERKIVGRSEGWPRPSTLLVFAMGVWVNAP